MKSSSELKDIAENYFRANNTVIQKARSIRLLLLDVDGVLSDGRISFDNQGTELKSFNTKDGQGLKLLRQSGIEVGIITGRKSSIVEKRAAELGITILIQGREDKDTAMNELLHNHTFELEQIAFMGDDYPDLRVMSKVGLSVSTADGHFAVKACADWISHREGGKGAVRDICDLLMFAQDNFIDALERHF